MGIARVTDIPQGGADRSRFEAKRGELHVACDRTLDWITHEVNEARIWDDGPDPLGS